MSKYRQKYTYMTTIVTNYVIYYKSEILSLQNPSGGGGLVHPYTEKYHQSTVTCIFSSKSHIFGSVYFLINLVKPKVCGLYKGKRSVTIIDMNEAGMEAYLLISFLRRKLKNRNFAGSFCDSPD